jgi:antitoxin HicB
MLVYPVIVTPDRNGTVIAEVRGFSGAITVGSTRADALQRVQEALVLMCEAHMDRGQPIPRPRKPKRGESSVPLPPMVAAKLAIYEAMRTHKVTQTALAARLGCDGRQVRRLLDLYHHSRLDQLDATLRALGKELVVDVRDAA